MDNALSLPAQTPLATPAGLGARLAALPMKSRVNLGVGVAMLVAVVVAITMWSSQGDYKVLYANLSDKDGGAIIAQLSQMNVPYKHSDGGAAILVPAAQVHDLRLKLASAGLPKGSVVGYELMDGARFGQTQFQEHGGALSHQPPAVSACIGGALVDRQRLCPVLSHLVSAAQRQCMSGARRIEVKGALQRLHGVIDLAALDKRCARPELHLRIIGVRLGRLNPAREDPILPSVRGVFGLDDERRNLMRRSAKLAAKGDRFTPCAELREQFGESRQGGRLHVLAGAEDVGHRRPWTPAPRDEFGPRPLQRQRDHTGLGLIQGHLALAPAFEQQQKLGPGLQVAGPGVESVEG